MPMTFLARYWKVLAIAATVAGALILVTRCTEQAEQRGYERARAQAAAALVKREREIAEDETRLREISRQHDIRHQESTRALQARIDDLTTRNVDLGRLRVRSRADCAAPAGAAPAAAEFDGGAWDRGHAVQASETAAGELGTELVRYAGECEAYRQRLIDLQGWVSATR
jgi:hypothetical protein